MSRTNIESRERRAWSTQEDRLLLEAVNKEDPGNPCPSRWSAIATHIPNRTNKDCRKRWFAHFATDIIKGAWTPEEDSRLIEAMDKYGPKWSKIAAVVKTRNSDQCAKRWKDTLDPTIDRTNWSAEADETLMRAVQEHGRLWTKIVNLYFPGKTGLAAKNRYNSLLALAKKTRNPSAYSAQPLYANAAPGATPGFTSSMSFTPSIPIANLLSDTSYFDRAACPATSPTSTVASRGLPVPVHTRMAYSAMIRQQQSSKLASVIPNPTSSDSVFAGYAGHTLDSYIGPFNPAALTSTNQQDHFFDMTAASSPETDNDTIDNFDMQACMNTISILSASPSASTSSVSSPMSNHSKVPPLVHSSSSSSSDSSTSSVSTGLFDAYNSSGDSFRSSSSMDHHSLTSHTAVSHSPLQMKVEVPDSPITPLITQAMGKTNLSSSFTRDELLLHIETLEALHQELSDQEQTLKSQRSSLNRIANAYRRQGDDMGARHYEQEASKRSIKLNFVFEQQEGVDAQIAVLRRNLAGAALERL